MVTKRIAWLFPSAGFMGAELERRVRQLRAWSRSEEIDGLLPENVPEFIDTVDDLNAVADAMAVLARDIRVEDYAVVVLGGAIDPGLRLCRESASVPVVGPFEVSMISARLLGLRVGVVSTDENVRRATQELVDRDPGSPVVTVRSLDFPVKRMVAALGEGVAQDAVYSLIRDSVREMAQEHGVDAVYFGSMTLGTLGIDSRLRTECGVYVVNPNRVALRAALERLSRE